MTNPEVFEAEIAIACGGTGGHFFPGLALGGEFLKRGCAVTLLTSQKEVDQRAVKTAHGLDVLALPAVGLAPGRRLASLLGFLSSYRVVAARFRQSPPDAVIGMGGFTTAPAVLAGRRRNAHTFLHESNSVPGRANRWLARFVDGVFVGFPSASRHLRARRLVVSGTPVRDGFGRGEPGASRTVLGLDPNRPVLLVTGGSQGASAVNKLILEALPIVSSAAPQLQWLHLTGTAEHGRVRDAYQQLGLKARVEPFLEDMESALDAATVAVCRAGASSIAELAAARLPAVLIPYPTATDNHQFYNAGALHERGAARLLEQRSTSAEELARVLLELLGSADLRENMRRALVAWHRPEAARTIAETVLLALSERRCIAPSADSHALSRRRSLA